jgi:hypothetical protein
MNSPVGSDETEFMYTIKLICLTVVNLIKQAGLLGVVWVIFHRECGFEP